MAGRNNKPKNDGKMATPSRLDQIGDRLAETTDAKPMENPDCK